MRKVLLCLLLSALLLPAADKKGKSKKEPDVTLLDFLARRENGLILIDGVVRVNKVLQPLNGMRVKFELFAPGRRLISQQESVISDELLEEGDEVPFYLQCRDHVRAVHIRVSFRSKKRMYLNLENPGPYGIE